MSDIISEILSDLTPLLNLTPPPPLSHTTLLSLQSLLSSTSQSGPNPLWAAISVQNLPLTSLTNPLTSTMDTPSSTPLSLLASDVYLSLFLAPHSPVFSLFSPLSFLSLLHSLRRAFKPRNISACSPPPPRKKPGPRGRANNNNNCTNNIYRDNLDTITASGGSGSGNTAAMSSEVVDVKMVLSVLEKLGRVLRLVHLGRFPESMRSLVQTIVEVPVLGVEVSGGSYKRMCDLCGVILGEVMRVEHGEVEGTAAEVLRCLAGLILSGKGQVRVFGVGFVRERMSGREDVRRAVVNLPRYLCLKSPEKAEGRGVVVEGVVEIVRGFERGDQLGFVDYVVKMARGKSQLRYLAVDLISKLMVMGLRDGGEEMEVDGEEEGEEWKVKCVEALIERCSDSVAGIRARALTNLAQLVGSASGDGGDGVVLKKVLGCENGKEGGLNELLRKRCKDEKAAVRKAALLLITKLMSLVGGSLDPEILKTMGMACSDPLVSIRKAAISALSEV